MSKIPPLPTGGEVIECWDRNGTSCYFFRRAYTNPRTGLPLYVRECVTVVVIKQPIRRHYVPRIVTTYSVADAKVAIEHATAIAFEPPGCLWTRYDRTSCPTIFAWLKNIYDGWRFPQADCPKFPTPTENQVLQIWDKERLSDRTLYVYRTKIDGSLILLETGFDDFEDGGNEEYWIARPCGHCLTDTIVVLGFFPDDDKHMLYDGDHMAIHMIDRLDRELMDWFRWRDKFTDRMSIPPRRPGVTRKLRSKSSKVREK